MSIKVDGERSRKRLPIAKKALALIKDMGFLSRAGIYDGFMYKVWQMDAGNLSGGFVVAPFGIAVLLSDANGTKQFVCDSAQCAAGLVGDRKVRLLDVTTTANEHVVASFAGAEDDGSTLNYSTGNAMPPGWRARRPLPIPYGGEVVLNYIAFNGHGAFVCSAEASHCFDTGSVPMPALNRQHRDVPPAGSDAGYFIPMRVTAGYFDVVYCKPGYCYYSEGSPVLMAYQYNHHLYGYGVSNVIAIPLFAAKGATYQFQQKLRIGNFGVPVYLRAAYYSRVAADVLGVSVIHAPHAVTCPDPDKCVTGSAAEIAICRQEAQDALDAAIEDPTSPCVAVDDKRFVLDMVFTSLAGGSQMLDFEQLRVALYALADGELNWIPPEVNPAYVSGDEDVTDKLRVVAVAVSSALFGWPVDSEYTKSARDTVTFADTDGVVYSWLRCGDPGATQNAEGGSFTGARQGGFKFSYPEGFTRTPLSMPPECLSNPALRPNVQLITETSYLCPLELAGGELAGCFLGSPFGSWTAIPMPSGATMLTVQVTEPADTVDEIGLVGIGKLDGVYFVFFKPGGGEWQRLSSIQAGEVDAATAAWGVCVFGDTGLSVSSQSVRQHPAIQASRPN